MQLHPKGPPGRANRKARGYTSEVRRLHAEGHTLESIRLALLDAGVSVSASTVRRELLRPASKWELQHPHGAASPLERGQENSHALPMPVMASTSAPRDATIEQLQGPADCMPDTRPREPLDDRHRAGPFSNVLRVLRQVLRARSYQ